MNDIPYGYCQCGCGQKTRIAKYSARQFGYVKGEPVYFVFGHANRRRISEGAEAVDAGFTSPCHIWQHRIDSSGYGRCGSERFGNEQMAHRIAYIEAHGAIPKGQQIHHLCHQPACVNPEHLIALTPQEHANMHPGRQKGHPWSHCKRGHELTPDNRYKDKHGRGSGCLRCRRVRHKEYHRTHRRA